MRKDNQIAVYDIAHVVSAKEQWYKDFFSKDCELSPEKALEGLQENVSERPEVLRLVDAEGMTVLHWAALRATASEKNRLMFDWLMDAVDVALLNQRVRRASDTIGSYDGETLVWHMQQLSSVVEIALFWKGSSSSIRIPRNTPHKK
eukprot:6372883-Amphidinium_carterae.2